MEKLQSLVSSDGRYRNLRDSLHRTDPPCIPYLGMYLSDLTFIEEGTPNFTDNGLLNFAKMRMVNLIFYKNNAKPPIVPKKCTIQAKNMELDCVLTYSRVSN